MENFHQAPSQMCYCMQNSHHVLAIAKLMIMYPDISPHIADLLPFNPETSQLMKFTFTENSFQEINQLIKSGSVYFLAISGQHSARAASWIQGISKPDERLVEIA